MKSKDMLKESKTGLTREFCDKNIQVVRSKRKGINKDKRKERKNIYTVLNQYDSKHAMKTLEGEPSSASERSISKHHKDYGRRISKPKQKLNSSDSNPRSSEENVVDYEYNRMFLVRDPNDDSKKLKKHFRSFSDRNLIHVSKRTDSENGCIADYITVMQEVEAAPGELPPEGAPEAGSEESKRRFSQSESNIANGERKNGCGAKCCPKNKNRKAGITPKCWMGLDDANDENVSCPRCSQVWQRGRSERQSRDGGGGCKCSQSRSRGGISSRGRGRSSGRTSKKRSSCRCSSRNNNGYERGGFGNLPDNTCISTYHNKATNFKGFNNPDVDHKRDSPTRDFGEQVDYCKECGRPIDVCECRKARLKRSVYSVYSLTNKDIFGSKKCLKCCQFVNNCQCSRGLQAMQGSQGSGTDLCSQTPPCCPTCGLSKEECNELKRTQVLPRNDKRCDCKQRILKKRLLAAVNICPKCRLPREDCICLEELLHNFKMGSKKKKCECVCKKPGQSEDGDDSLDKLLQEAFNTCPKCGREKNQCICLEELLLDIKQTINRQQRQINSRAAMSGEQASGGCAEEKKSACCCKNQGSRGNMRRTEDYMVVCSDCNLPKEGCDALKSTSQKKQKPDSPCKCKKLLKSLSKMSLRNKISNANNECDSSNVFHVQVQNSGTVMSKLGNESVRKQCNGVAVNIISECPHCHKSQSKCECQKSSSCKECDMPKLMCQCKSPSSVCLGDGEKLPKAGMQQKKNNYCDCSVEYVVETGKNTICEVCLRPENNCVCKKDTSNCQKCGKRKVDGKRNQHSENKSRKGGSERSRSTVNRKNNICEIRKVTRHDTRHNHFGCQPSEEFLMRVCESRKYPNPRNVVDSRECIARKQKVLRRPSSEGVDRSPSDEENERVTSTCHLDSYEEEKRMRTRTYAAGTPDLCSECCAHSQRSYRSKEVRSVSPTIMNSVKHSRCNHNTYGVEKTVGRDKQEVMCNGSPSTFQKLRSRLQRCTGCGKKHKKRQFENTQTQCNYAGVFDKIKRKTVEGGDKSSVRNDGKASGAGNAVALATVGNKQIDSHNTVITKQFNEIVKVLLPPKEQHSTESVEEYGRGMKD